MPSDAVITDASPAHNRDFESLGEVRFLELHQRREAALGVVSQIEADLVQAAQEAFQDSERVAVEEIDELAELAVARTLELLGLRNDRAAAQVTAELQRLTSDEQVIGGVPRLTEEFKMTLDLEFDGEGVPLVYAAPEGILAAYFVALLSFLVTCHMALKAPFVDVAGYKACRIIELVDFLWVPQCELLEELVSFVENEEPYKALIDDTIHGGARDDTRLIRWQTQPHPDSAPGSPKQVDSPILKIYERKYMGGPYTLEDMIVGFGYPIYENATKEQYGTWIRFTNAPASGCP